MPAKAKSLPTIKYPGTAAAFIAVATSQLSYREGSNNDTIYGSWYGMNRQPWCAMFISWVAEQSGCRAIVPKHAYTPSGAQWFKNRKQWFNSPRVGDIVYYDTAGMGRISHVGVVTAVHEDGSWTACEGNTNGAGSREGNGVYMKRRTTVGQRGGFGRPAYAKMPAEAKPAKVEKNKAWKPKSMKLRALKDEVRPGATHPQVRLLQWCLYRVGYGDLSGECTSFYGPATQAAVADFHERNPRFKSYGKRRDPVIGESGFRSLQKQAGLR